MGYRLGVDLGTSFTGAAISRGNAVEVVALGENTTVPSVIHIGTGGAVRYGDQAAAAAAADPGRVLRGFIRRVGDETPMLPGEKTPSTAHQLAADLVAWVVARVSDLEGEAPAAVAVTHPSGWGAHKCDLLTGALAALGLADVVLIAEPIAAALAATAGDAIADGSTVAVYDFGGTSFDATLLRRTDGVWAQLGRAAGLPDLGGADLDDAVFAHVLTNLSPDARRAIDAASTEQIDPATAAALSAVRAGCRRAKEELSAQTAATVAVALPAVRTSVRLTRAELEALIAPSIEATVDAVDAVLADAGIDATALDRVLIAGGSARIPLVTQLLSRSFGVPVQAAADDPAVAAVRGAVLALGAGPARVAAPATRAEAAPPAETAEAAEAAVVAPALEPPKAARSRKPIGVAAAIRGAVAAAALPAPALATATPAADRVRSVDTSHGQPIRARRGARRPEVGSASSARCAVLDAPRAVVPSGPLRTLDDLLAAVPAPAAPAPPARPAGRGESVDAEQLPPPRPPLAEAAALDPPAPAPALPRAPWTWRSLVTLRRSLALSALTVTIFAGSGAWVPAIPAIVETPQQLVQHMTGTDD